MARLKLHNAAFARIWELGPEELRGEPHVRSIAALCTAKFGDGAMWDRLIQAIVSEAGVTRDLGEVERNDRIILSLGLSPLPDGASLVTFADVTDRFRIETALRDRADALEAADRLKSEFIKHVSYELRTPLNTIMGFAEHLASGVPGALNPRQGEYVDAIVAGSNTLKDLVNDILDLALIESGALRLELERLDLYGLLADVANHARDWAAKVGLTLELDCQPNAGLFLADPRRMRQVVFNLLSNAFKFTPRRRRHPPVRTYRGRRRTDYRRRQWPWSGTRCESQCLRAFRRPEPGRNSRRRRTGPGAGQPLPGIA